MSIDIKEKGKLFFISLPFYFLHSCNKQHMFSNLKN